MSEVVPTVTEETADAYKATIESHNAFTKRAHIDIMDGEFAPTFSVGVNQLWWPQDWQVDIHAMVAHPSQYVDALIQMKPALIIFHAEVNEDLTPTLQKIRAAGIKAGVALLRPTVPATVRPYIEAADHALIFAGDLGHYGGKASLMQLEKVRLVRNIKPNIQIGWDGGATVENIYSLSQGGIDVLNCGNVIRSSKDPAATYKQLVDELNKHSVI